MSDLAELLKVKDASIDAIDDFNRLSQMLLNIAHRFPLCFKNASVSLSPLCEPIS